MPPSANLVGESKRQTALRWVITLGGLVVIASVIAILLLIVGVTLPLLRISGGARIGPVPLPQSTAAGDVLAVGIELPVGEESGTVHLLTRDGTVSFLDLDSPDDRAPHRDQSASRVRSQVRARCRTSQRLELHAHLG